METIADLQTRVHVLEVERNKLTVSLSIARADAFALEAELAGLRRAVEVLRKAERPAPEPRA